MNKAMESEICSFDRRLSALCPQESFALGRDSLPFLPLFSAAKIPRPNFTS
jgi:hypothetical protein